MLSLLYSPVQSGLSPKTGPLPFSEFARWAEEVWWLLHTAALLYNAHNYSSLQCNAYTNTALHTTRLHITSMQYKSYHYTTLHFATLQWTPLPYTTLHTHVVHCTFTFHFNGCPLYHLCAVKLVSNGNFFLYIELKQGLMLICPLRKQHWFLLWNLWSCQESC